MKKVSILSVGLKPYRNSFYRHLTSELVSKDICLHVYHGSDMQQVNRGGILPQEIDCPVKVTRIRNKATYHHLPSCIRDSNLIIMSQQASMLSNYELLLRSKLGGKFRTAFWGHGRNLRPSENQKTTEWFKTKFSTHVDWWFAYNDFSANIVRDLGYPNERITNVRNSIDTTTLMSAHDSVKPAALESLRVAMGITSTNVAVYTGGLTEQKRIGFLLESAVLVRRLVPDFHLIILGDGPLSEEVGAIASTHDWIHYEGAKHDTEKVPYWALSKLLLMPGGVGLVVLDSFALGIPMVTTENRFHGPEIEYLKDGVNGLMVKPGDDPEHYAAEVAALLRDDARREAMAAAALVERDRYSSEDMAQRFATGIMQALDAPRYRVFF